MKKLNKIEKTFASLENKKLSNLKEINGGAMIGSAKTREKTSFGTSGSDINYYTDGKLTATLTVGS